jgi:hypothetical protein
MAILDRRQPMLLAQRIGHREHPPELVPRVDDVPRAVAPEQPAEGT